MLDCLIIYQTTRCLGNALRAAAGTWSAEPSSSPLFLQRKGAEELNCSDGGLRTRLRPCPFRRAPSDVHREYDPRRLPQSSSFPLPTCPILHVPSSPRSPVPSLLTSPPGPIHHLFLSFSCLAALDLESLLSGSSSPSFAHVHVRVLGSPLQPSHDPTTSLSLSFFSSSLFAILLPPL